MLIDSPGVQSCEATVSIEALHYSFCMYQFTVCGKHDMHAVQKHDFQSARQLLQM